jgi:hypothetical protein
LDALRAALVEDPHDAVHAREAWAILVCGLPVGEVALDDELLCDLIQVVDTAACELQAAGLHLLFQSDRSVLAAVAVGDDAQRDRLFTLATRLHAQLRGRPDRDERVDIAVCVHRDNATIREFGRDCEITGGAVADVERWAARLAHGGAYATPAAIGGPESPTDSGDGEPDAGRLIPLPESHQ